MTGTDEVLIFILDSEGIEVAELLQRIEAENADIKIAVITSNSFRHGNHELRFPIIDHHHDMGDLIRDYREDPKQRTYGPQFNRKKGKVKRYESH